jgi:hypothetical protein
MNAELETKAFASVQRSSFLFHRFFPSQDAGIDERKEREHDGGDDEVNHTGDGARPAAAFVTGARRAKSPGEPRAGFARTPRRGFAAARGKPRLRRLVRCRRKRGSLSWRSSLPASALC